MHIAKKLRSWLVNGLLARTPLERNVIACPYPTSGHFVWGMLYLGALQELTYQGSLLREGACQFGDLSG